MAVRALSSSGGATRGSFQLGAAPPATPAPGTSLTVEVSYNGRTPGQHDGTLTLIHEANEGRETRVFLRAFT